MKKLFAMLLALCLLVPAMAMAENTLKLTRAGSGTNLLEGSTSATLTSGAYELSGEYDGTWGINLYIKGDVDLTLSGLNVAASQKDCSGLYIEKSDDYTSDATLDLTLVGDSEISGDWYGMFIERNLPTTIGGAGSLRAAGTDEGTGVVTGLYCYSDLTMNGGTVTGVSKSESGIGVTVENPCKLTVNGGKITGESTGSGDRSFGFTCYDLSISGGEVVGKSINSFGIDCYGPITVSGGSVTGESESADYNGIYAGEVIQGGTAPLCFMVRSSDIEPWMPYEKNYVLRESRAKITTGVNATFKASGAEKTIGVPKNSDDWLMPFSDLLGGALEGYQFNTWMDETGKSHDAVNYGPALTGDAVFTADVTKNPWLTYLDQNGGIGRQKKNAVAEETVYDYMYGTPAGQTFSHYVVKETGKIVYEYDMVEMNGDVTLEPVFAPTIAIKWVMDGKVIYDLRVAKDAIVEAWQLSNDKKREFTGWKVEGTDIVLRPDERFYADRPMTLVAQFEEKKMAKVTYVFADGTATDVYTPRGETYRVDRAAGNIFTEDGEEYFAYWLAEGSAEPIYEGETILVNGDMTLKAHYKPVGESFSYTYTTDRYKTVLTGEGSAGQPVSIQMDLRHSIPIVNSQYDVAGAKVGNKTYGPHDVILLEEDGMEIVLILEKRDEPTRIPTPQEIAAAGDLPQTGDASSLMGWAMLLAASGAAGMKLRRKK